ncbi:MAG TPA: glycyl-radical enzyme activating protein [Bacillota bacterium]|nr:glycyl-radical enzyme activating protein [Bacillota bacterium]HQB80981.1 glycyl-radical enzyme activating protein [Bacillota bacterium]
MHYLFDIQRLSMENGPGLRTTLFFAGCPLSCPWCHNPEGQPDQPVLLYFQDRCIKCGNCEHVCVDNALDYDPETGPKINYSNCTGCGKCADVCPAESLLMSAKQYSVKDIMQIVLRDRPYYDRSQGGVTLSGGEPLAQDVGALEALMKEIKKEKINLSIDTSGAIPRLNLETALKYADSFLYDLKHLDPIKHKEFTKSDNRQILDNLIWLSKQDTVIHLRIPVIPGFNGEKEELEAMADWIAGNITPETIALLPYHLFGRSKYVRMGLDGQRALFKVPSGDFMNKALQLFLDKGLSQTGIGGAILASKVK